MYRCEFCKKVVPPRVPCKKIVTQTREVMHPYRAKVKKKMVIDKNGKLKQDWLDDIGGPGTQIVKEAQLCTSCALDFEKKKAEKMGII